MVLKKIPGKISNQIKPLLLVCFLILLATGNANASVNNQKNTSHKTTENKSIKIGLLIPDDKRIAAKHGADLAIKKANDKGGLAGVPFELIAKATSGPWGTSSKKSVSLVFEDEVLVMMGSLDNRNAHLAEQVAAKTKLVYLSAWATDMSLSNAYVPWYFRVVPNDKQQASTLIDEIWMKRKLKNVAVIGTEKSDSELAVRAFMKEAERKDVTLPVQYSVSLSEKNPFTAFSENENKNWEAIILIGDNEFATKIIPLLKMHYNDIPLFASISTMDSQHKKNINWKLFENVTFVSTGFLFTEEGIKFQGDFRNEFGYNPGPAAAYAFDAMNVIIEAVKMAKPTIEDVIDDRDKIIDAFSNIHYEGISGMIQFDKMGNRLNNVSLMRIEKGEPVIIEDEKK